MWFQIYECTILNVRGKMTSVADTALNYHSLTTESTTAGGLPYFSMLLKGQQVHIVRVNFILVRRRECHVCTGNDQITCET